MVKLFQVQSNTMTGIINSIKENTAAATDELRGDTSTSLYVSRRRTSATGVLAAAGLPQRQNDRRTRIANGKEIVATAIKREHGVAAFQKVQHLIPKDKEQAITVQHVQQIARHINVAEASQVSAAMRSKKAEIISDLSALREHMRSFPDIGIAQNYVAAQEPRSGALAIGAFALNVVQDTMQLEGETAKTDALSGLASFLKVPLAARGIRPDEKIEYKDAVKAELHHVMSLLTQLLPDSNVRERASSSVAIDVDSPTTTVNQLCDAYQAEFQRVIDHQLNTNPITFTWGAIPVSPGGAHEAGLHQTTRHAGP